MSAANDNAIAPAVEADPVEQLTYAVCAFFGCVGVLMILMGVFG